MAVVAALAVAAAAYAAPGAPDRSFGTAGSTTIDFPTSAQASLSLQQPGGRLVSIGTVGSSGFGLVRYVPGGGLDPTFGAGGRVLTELGRDVAVRDAALQGDGKIVVAGTADGSNVVARYNPDGSLDPTFGSGGIARESSLATAAASAAAVTGQAATPVEAGSLAEDFAARFGAEEVRPLALSVGPGRRILVAGSASVAGVPQLAVAQLDGDGSPDDGFGDGGRASYPLAGDIGPARVEAAAVEGDGTVLVAGTPGAAGATPGELVLSRYAPDGALDESFGTGGAVALPAFGDEVRGVAVEPAGRIVIAGSESGNGVAALTPDGRPDPSFGTDGTAPSPLGEGSVTDGIAPAGDELLVYGESGGQVALARLRPDGTLDPSFGHRGTVVSSIPAFDPGTARAAVEPDGRIAVAGTSGDRVALARFNADGSADRAFGDGGSEISGVRGTATAIAASPDGGILVAGTRPNADDGFVVARFGDAATEPAGAERRAAPAAAEPRRPRRAHRLGPPNPVPAWYVNATSFRDLKRFAAQDACKFAHTQPRSAQRTLILDFGGARAYSDGSFGAAVNNATFAATNQQILKALKVAADAYALCHRQGRATIAYANTNHFSFQSVADRARQIGVDQAKTVVKAGAYARAAGYARAVGAGVAGDLEPGYWGPKKSKALANGAKSVRRHDYMDFGTAGGCPPYLKGQRRPRHHKCLNDWTLDDVAHVANSGGGEPLPEIYYRGGRLHFDQAAQWGRVAQRWNSNHATPFTFFGATGSTEFSALTPSESWKRLKAKTSGHVGRELLNFRQDHGPTLTAAMGSGAPAR